MPSTLRSICVLTEKERRLGNVLQCVPFVVVCLCCSSLVKFYLSFTHITIINPPPPTHTHTHPTHFCILIRLTVIVTWCYFVSLSPKLDFSTLQ
jgi:hypothetical protein